MKTICITGTHATDVDFIQGILTQAGMGQAQSPQRDPSMTIGFWHEQVEARIKEMPAQAETVELGRVWEQIASDIFVANMSQPTWGWADTRSARVLDFWQLFDPQVRFVLVACSAQRHIAHALAAGVSMDSVKGLMTEWVEHQLRLLQFLHRFPQKTILVDVEQCIDHPAGLIKACQQTWELNLSKVHFPAQPAIQFTTLEQFLARELIQTDDQWQVLEIELWSSATPVGSLWKISSQINVFDAVKAYRSDQAKYIESQVTSAERLNAERRELSKQLEIAHASAAALKTEADAARVEADAAKAEVHATKASLQSTMTEVAAAQAALAQKTSEANPLATQLKEAQEESDLLLAQLHQVQEELEKVFLENQTFKNKISEIEPLNLKAQDLTKKLDVANAQVVKQKKELDAAHASAASLKKEVDTAKAEVTAAQAALAQKTSEANPLATQLKDAQEESDLLLAQLHQVQEELEHYFLKYQDIKNTLEFNELRWKRMLQRQPDYFDLESVEVVHFGDPKSLHIEWQLKGLDPAGRLIPELQLTSSVEGGVACLELPRKMGEQPVFVRWPLAAANKATLTVAVVGDAKTGRERADILLQLGRSDWDLVQVILNVLINEVQTPGLLKFPKEFASDKVLDSFKVLKARLAQLPPVFRFDEIKLKREQVNPDYEHLWLDFRHVAIGAKRLLDFDFRISCANVRPKTFGEYPKLEFPETSGRSAITGWFDEAYDDFGAKLELRFSVPQSMDLQVWEQLPEPDRLFLSSLINQIPALLGELETSGIEVKRGWADWQQLAKEVRRILAICTVSKTEFENLPPPAPKTKKVASTPRVASTRQVAKN
jgi:hypothetical protein